VYDQRDGWAVFTYLHGIFWSVKRCLERMYDAALRKSSDNQHSLDSGRWLGIRCEYDCQHHHKGGYGTCEIRLIRILESLTAWRILLRTVGRILVFLRACFSRWWATLRHVHIQCRNTTQNTMTCNYWYRHSQQLERSQVYTGLSSHVSVPYLVYFHYLTGITNQLAQIEN